MPYRTLDRAKIAKTAEKLERRIADRFPQSSLRNVARETSEIVRDLGRHAEELARPLWWVRILLGAFVIGCIYLFSQVGTLIQISGINEDASNVIQGLEAAINTIVFVCVGIYGLATFEQRIKRSRSLKKLHVLRSVIHIIDMHQLTKDPAVLASNYEATKNSPERMLTPAELARYLDYCSELLSITGKVAALYAQSVDDDVVVGAVNDVESLGTNLSRKIWQKIMLIEAEGRPLSA
ncbi:MAG: hypothetical protein AAGI92_03055 [Pseudomonadota bacterium]